MQYMGDFLFTLIKAALIPKERIESIARKLESLQTGSTLTGEVFHLQMLCGLLFSEFQDSVLCHTDCTQQSATKFVLTWNLDQNLLSESLLKSLHAEVCVSDDSNEINVQAIKLIPHSIDYRAAIPDDLLNFFEIKN